ncbi:MAG: PAS domain-containing protein [Bacteroidetes bacterium]|nr:PAS domain-containing protein [Bacteroidota bacterium]
MVIDNKDLLSENNKLARENRILRQQLMIVNNPDGVKVENIDAFVVAKDNKVKVFTEAAADNPYRILIEKMNEGAVTVNEKGIILYCNSSFATMVKTPMEKIVGNKFRDFIVESSKELFDSLLAQGKDGSIKEEIIIGGDDMNGMPVLLSLNALNFDSGFIISIILTDLTVKNNAQRELERKTTQLGIKNAELENANKELESFNYVSSHDLQEPLRKIESFVSIILNEEEKNLSVEGKGYFKSMQDTAKRMQMLIEDLLTYSRTKNAERKFEVINLTVVLKEVKKEYESVIKKQNVVIDIKELCDVTIIRFQFFQLFQNLFSNSLKFARADKPLHITVKSEKGKGCSFSNEKLTADKNYCHITFMDNGIGFESQYQDRVFELFQRLNSKDDYEGTGIGLAICKRIIDNHSGFITASSAVNKGVTFDIYIPA